MPAAQLKKSQGRSKHQTEPSLKGCIYFICARGAHTNIFHYSLFSIHYNNTGGFLMPQLWQGRSSKAVDSRVNDFNSSIRFDARMIEQDIHGSMVHSAMLGKQGIISQQDVDDIHRHQEPPQCRRPARYRGGS